MEAKFKTGTVEKLQRRVKEEKDAIALRKVQTILLGAEGYKAKDVSKMTRYKEGYVRELWYKYRKIGDNLFVSGNTKTRNGSYLSMKEEKQFLAPFLETAKRAGVLIVTDIHNALKKKVGKGISIVTTYNLLHRHGWRKIVPRPYHPKRDSEKREEWMKSFPPQSKKGERES